MNQLGKKNIGSNIKTISYKSDGLGRDTYVFYNSGGIETLAKDPIFFVRENNTQLSSIPSQTPIRPYIPPKVKHYYSDGTGRDKYIVCDEGGFLKAGLKNNYINSLRRYQSPQNHKKHLFSGIPHQPPIQTTNININQQVQIQNQMSQRLARPIIEKKYRSLSPQQSPLNMQHLNSKKDDGIIYSSAYRTFQKPSGLENQNQENKEQQIQENKGQQSIRLRQQLRLQKPLFPIPSNVVYSSASYIRQSPKMVRYYKKGKEVSPNIQNSCKIINRDTQDINSNNEVNLSINFKNDQILNDIDSNFQIIDEKRKKDDFIKQQLKSYLNSKNMMTLQTSNNL